MTKSIVEQSLSNIQGDIIMSLAENLKKEGFQKGIKQGMQQGIKF